jgi:hypothetical protein
MGGGGQPLRACLFGLRPPKCGLSLIEILLPFLGRFRAGGAKVLGRPASNAMFVANGLVDLLTKTTLLVFGVLGHIDPPVLLR